MSGLRTRAAKGTILMTAVQFSARPIRMVALIFLARLLDPQDFGLVALAMILVGATDLFSGLGMGSALIHTRLDPRKVAAYAFLVTLIFSAFLFLVLNTQAPFFADLLGDPEVAPVLRWLSGLILLNGVYLIPEALLSKELLFRQVSTARIISVLVYNGVAVLLAFLGFGLWSLVYAELARALSRLVAVCVASPSWDWLIPRSWDWKALKGLLRYGIQSTGGGFLSYFNTNWDDWLVGRLIGSTALGFYSKAYDISNRGIVNLNIAVNSVFFPSYAKIQDDKERLSRIYLKHLGVVALVMTPLSMGLFVVAAELVPIIFGEKWIPMVLSLQIFAFMALIRPLAASTSPVFMAVGRPDLNLRVSLVLLAAMAPLLFLLLGKGIAGVAVAVTVSYTVAFLYSVHKVQEILPGTAPRMMHVILPPFFASGVMVLGVQFSKPMLSQLAGGQHNLATLGGMIVIGVLLYGSIAFLIQRALIMETISLVMSVFKDRKRMALNRP